MDADTVGGEAQLQFKADSTNTDVRIKSAIIFRRDDPGTRGTGNLHFCVNGDNNDVSASTSHSRMMIDANGMVGIGNTSPFSTSKLHIKTAHGVPATSGTTQGRAALCLEPQPNIRFDIGSNYYWGSGVWFQTGNTTDLSAKYAIHLNPRNGASAANGGAVGIANLGATPSASQAGFMFTGDQFYTSAGAATRANTQVRFYNGNGLVGNITTSGSATAFNTSSDY